MVINEKFEILTTGNNIIIKEVTENPLLEATTKQGLLMPKGMHVETEEAEGVSSISQLNQAVKLGKVLVVGNECKTTKVGDYVYFDVRSIQPFAIGPQEFLMRLSEVHAIAVVRERTENE